MERIEECCSVVLSVAIEMTTGSAGKKEERKRIGVAPSQLVLLNKTVSTNIVPWFT